MSKFNFVTVWKIEAPLEPVWNAMLRFEEWPKWWKGVEEVKVLAPGDANRVGFRSQQTWKSKLWYTLRFEGEVTKVEPMSRIELTSGGNLFGTGLMRFRTEGSLTVFQYDWNVGTTIAWMNLMGPLLKPAFSWNHDVIMNWGAEGIARKVGAKNISTSEQPIF